MNGKDKYRINNIVRIGSNEKIEMYIYSIVVRMNPIIYNEKEHGNIIIRVKDSLIDFTDILIKHLRWIGLVEVSRKKKQLVNEKEGYTISNGWEIILKKIPVLEMMEAEDITDDG